MRDARLKEHGNDFAGIVWDLDTVLNGSRMRDVDVVVKYNYR